MKDNQFFELMKEMKKQTSLLNKILEENEMANSQFEEYAKDSLRELREVKIRLIDNLKKLN